MKQVPQRYVADWPIDHVKPDPANPNVGDIDGIASAIDDLGFYGAVLLQEPRKRDNGIATMIGGEHRWRAALERGASTIPAILLDVPMRTARRILVGDNELARKSRTDFEKLHTLLSPLGEAGLLGGTGFTDDDVDKLRLKFGTVDVDAYQRRAGEHGEEDVEPPPDPTTKPGDIWQLGDHRVMCGDARLDIGTLLDGTTARCIWTDPPYGINYAGQAGTIEGDSPDQATELLELVVPELVAHTAPGSTVWVAAPAGRMLATFLRILIDHDIFRQTCVWVKDQLVLGRTDFHYRHEAILFGGIPDPRGEPIAYGWMPGAPHFQHPDRTADTVFEFPRPRTSKEHPTMKPIDLVAYNLARSTPGPVLDPFAGSGTTLLAAELEGRPAFCLETSPGFVDVICRRWQTMTDQRPIRIRTGKAHDFTKAA